MRRTTFGRPARRSDIRESELARPDVRLRSWLLAVGLELPGNAYERSHRECCQRWVILEVGVCAPVIGMASTEATRAKSSLARSWPSA